MRVCLETANLWAVYHAQICWYCGVSFGSIGPNAKNTFVSMHNGYEAWLLMMKVIYM